MKKILGLSMLLVMMLMGNVYAELDMEYDKNTTTYTISGETVKRSIVTLRVLYLGEEKESLPLDIENLPQESEEYADYLSYIDVVKADKYGVYELSCKMDKLSGYYYFSLTDAKGNQDSKLLEWLSPTYKEEKLAVLNKYIEENDADNVTAFLKKYKVGFDIESKYFDELLENSENTLAEALIKIGKAETPEDLKQKTILASIFCVFTEKDVEKSMQVLEYYQSECGLDKNEAFNTTLKEGVSQDVKNALIEEIQNIDCAEAEKLAEKIEEIVVLKGIGFSEDWGTVQNILLVNQNVLSKEAREAYLDLQKAYPSYFANVAKAIKGQTPQTFAELDSLVINEVKNAKSAAINASNSAGGTGGSGGGSGSKKSGSSVILSGATEINPVVDEAPVVQKKTFEDLESVKWAEDAICYLAEKGIVSGRDENHFDPNATIKREEFLSIVIRAFNLLSDEAECDFADTDKSAWYYKAVASAYEKGITSGINENEFGIGMNITREDLCVLAYNTARKSGKELTGNKNISFSDYDNISDYAKTAVSTMAECGIVSGMENGEFLPKSNATRAQTALIVYNLINN